MGIFTTPAYASAVLGVSILCVCQSVCHTRGFWIWIWTRRTPLEKYANDSDKTKCKYFDTTRKALILVLWHQQWFAGNATFFLKSALKVTHPFEKRWLRQISAYDVSTVRDSEKKFKHDEQEVDHGLCNML